MTVSDDLFPEHNALFFPRFLVQCISCQNAGEVGVSVYDSTLALKDDDAAIDLFTMFLQKTPRLALDREEVGFTHHPDCQESQNINSFEKKCGIVFTVKINCPFDQLPQLVQVLHFLHQQFELPIQNQSTPTMTMMLAGILIVQGNSNHHFFMIEQHREGLVAVYDNLLGFKWIPVDQFTSTTRVWGLTFKRKDCQSFSFQPEKYKAIAPSTINEIDRVRSAEAAKPAKKPLIGINAGKYIKVPKPRHRTATSQLPTGQLDRQSEGAVLSHSDQSNTNENPFHHPINRSLPDDNRPPEVIACGTGNNAAGKAQLSIDHQQEVKESESTEHANAGVLRLAGQALDPPPSSKSIHRSEVDSLNEATIGETTEHANAGVLRLAVQSITPHPVHDPIGPFEPADAECNNPMMPKSNEPACSNNSDSWRKQRDDTTCSNKPSSNQEIELDITMSQNCHVSKQPVHAETVKPFGRPAEPLTNAEGRHNTSIAGSEEKHAPLPERKQTNPFDKNVSPPKKTRFSEAHPYAIISLFDGVGSALTAISQAIGRPPAVLIAAECDPVLTQIVGEQFRLRTDGKWSRPDKTTAAIYVDDIRKLLQDQCLILREAFALAGTSCRWFVIAGSPCQDLTIAGPFKGLLGLTGQCSHLFYYVHIVLWFLQTNYPVDLIRFLIGNAGTMLELHRRAILVALGLQEDTAVDCLRFDPKQTHGIKRNRFFFRNYADQSVVVDTKKLHPEDGFGPLLDCGGHPIPFGPLLRVRATHGHEVHQLSWTSYQPISLLWDYHFWGGPEEFQRQVKMQSTDTMPALDFTAALPPNPLQAWNDFVSSLK